MKICVYAICKNEERFVQRWMDSMQEADAVVAADTGSEDNTVRELRRLGAAVTRITVSPWRFDRARNMALELVPEDADICVCTDLDEVFAEKGWRKTLERAWADDVTRLKYPYIWSFNPDGSVGFNFHIEKIHARHGFKWVHPVHEVLAYSGSLKDKSVLCEELCLHHYPDETKSRSQYLPLLELSVREAPDDDRNMHYLGREYLFCGRQDDCIRTLTAHLALPSAVWRDERCASMRYIARAYREKGDLASCKSWLYRAIAEAPHLREPYADMAMHCYLDGDWAGVLHMVDSALHITDKPMSYINEPSSWDHTLYDLGAVGCFNLGMMTKAHEFAVEALSRSPDNERLQQNAVIIRNALNEA